MNSFIETMLKDLDLYCERCCPGFWEEPLNALTNVSFLIAAYFTNRLAKREQMQTMQVSVCIGLAVSVGIGSFLFHTFANVLTMWLDIIPILLFQCFFVWTYSRHIMQLPLPATIGLIAILIGGGVAGGPLTHILNGSLSYLPALLILGCLAAWHRKHGNQETDILLLATGIFFISLVFRTIDMTFCSSWPWGTHFLWHLCNGMTFYLAMRCLILNLPRPHLQPNIRQN